MFKLSYLSEFDNSKKLLEFSNKFFICVGGGTSRSVYSLNDDYVIKVAKNQMGIWQNESEIRTTNSASNNGLILPVCRYDKNALWVVQRKAQPIGYDNKDFFDVICGVRFQKVCQLIGNIKQGRDLDSLCVENPFMMMVADFISKQETKFFHDLEKIDSYGYLDGRVYLIDYGMDNETFDLYLNGKGCDMRSH